MDKNGCYFCGQYLDKQELTACNYLTLNIEAAIPTDGNNAPIKSYTLRLSCHRSTWLKGELKRMLQNNVIQPSKSHIVSPIVFVPKGEGYRLCVNYKELNKRINIPHNIVPNQ